MSLTFGRDERSWDFALSSRTLASQHHGQATSVQLRHPTIRKQPRAWAVGVKQAFGMQALRSYMSICISDASVVGARARCSEAIEVGVLLLEAAQRAHTTAVRRRVPDVHVQVCVDACRHLVEAEPKN